MIKSLFSHLQEMAEFSDAIRVQAHILLFVFVSWKWIKIWMNSLLSLPCCVFSKEFHFFHSPQTS